MTCYCDHKLYNIYYMLKFRTLNAEDHQDLIESHG